MSHRIDQADHQKGLFSFSLMRFFIWRPIFEMFLFIGQAAFCWPSNNACESAVSGANSNLIRLQSPMIWRQIASSFYTLRKNVGNKIKNNTPKSGRLKMTFTNAVDESVKYEGLA